MCESKIQTEILRYLERNECYVVKVVLSNKSGVPDILFCKDGLFYTVEVKATGKKKSTTKLQDWNLQKVIESGGKAIVTDKLSDVIEMIKG